MSKNNVILKRKALLGDGTTHEVSYGHSFLHPDMWEVGIDQISTSTTYSITQRLKIKRIIIDGQEVLSPSDIGNQSTFENNNVLIVSNLSGRQAVKFKTYNASLPIHTVYFQLEYPSDSMYPMGYFKYIRTPRNLGNVTIAKVRLATGGYDSDGIDLYLMSDSVVNVAGLDTQGNVLKSYIKNGAKLYVPKEMLHKYLADSQYIPIKDNIEGLDFIFVEDDINS